MLRDNNLTLFCKSFGVQVEILNSRFEFQNDLPYKVFEFVDFDKKIGECDFLLVHIYAYLLLNSTVWRLLNIEIKPIQ